MSPSEQTPLHRRARRIIQEHGPAEVQELARKLLDELPEEEYRAALEQVLPLYVRQVLMENRPAARQMPPAAAPRPAFTGGFSTGSTSSAPPVRFHPPSVPRPAAPRAERPRTRGFHGAVKVREGWQRALDAQVQTDAGPKRLRDCTRVDLDQIAARLDTQADQTKQRARWYREVGRQLTEAGARTVGDLPAETHMRLLSEAT